MDKQEQIKKIAGIASDIILPLPHARTFITTNIADDLGKQIANALYDAGFRFIPDKLSKAPIGATCHYEHDNQGQWWIVWGADFPQDKAGKVKVKDNEQFLLECGYQEFKANLPDKLPLLSDEDIFNLGFKTPYKSNDVRLPVYIQGVTDGAEAERDLIEKELR